MRKVRSSSGIYLLLHRLIQADTVASFEFTCVFSFHCTVPLLHFVQIIIMKSWTATSSRTMRTTDISSNKSRLRRHFERCRIVKRGKWQNVPSPTRPVQTNFVYFRHGSIYDQKYAPERVALKSCVHKTGRARNETQTERSDAHTVPASLQPKQEYMNNSSSRNAWERKSLLCFIYDWEGECALHIISPWRP